MKPIKRSELFPGNLIRLYLPGCNTPWGWIQGRVIDNGPGFSKVVQLRVFSEKKQYSNDASNIGLAKEIYGGDLIFKVDVEDMEAE
jgi:hypothetical protein